MDVAGWAAVVVGAVDEVGKWHFQLSTSSTALWNPSDVLHASFR
jgi:hypothetical protein